MYSAARSRWSRAASRLLRASSTINSTKRVALAASSTVQWSPNNSSSMSAMLAERSFSSYSSFTEPDPLLFKRAAEVSGEDGSNSGKPLPNGMDVYDAQLRNDIRVMGSLLGNVIKEHEGSDLFEKVENMRLLAKKWRESGCQDKEAFDYLTTFATQLTDDELFSVSRSFTHFLGIVNAAEAHHRIRRLQQVTMESDQPSGALYPKDDSCGGAIPGLLRAGHSAEEIWEAISTQTTEFVLTAHPTEVNRRTLLDKKRRIQSILTKADEYRALNEHGIATRSYEMDQLHSSLAREISSIWLSDEVSRAKPTPEKEAIKGTLVLETVLWETVPQYLRKLDATCLEFLGKRLPLTSAPIRFASWMGGDRDGNPNVKPKTTREVCLRNRFKAADLFFEDLKKLHNQLSITECSPELREIVGPDVREPYRKILDKVIHNIYMTRNWAEQELWKVQGITKNVAQKTIPKDEIYLDQEEFKKDLMLIHRSLCESGNGLIADGLLTDIIRNISSFGLTLIPLDVRQESNRHEEAVDAITRYLGLGSYSQWDEETKINWLTTQISSKRPLLRKGVWNENPNFFSETAVDTLETFAMIADQYEGSLGAYVISQATSASDVLAVLLLQIDAGVKKPLRVAPLFETLDDLNGAVDTMRKLFSLPAYMGTINGKQEVMIGYSDSAKDAGRLAAVWAQYETQEELAKVARDFGVDMTFFHGKGGSVGRGGNPQTYYGILAHAPNTINGYFRVTEQGEMINQNFGYKDVAERTLDIYSSAVLVEKLRKRSEVKQDWKDLMDDLSDISCEAYRKVVRGDERFVPYFHEVTPDLSNLNIGSRPAKRKASGGVESLRAIPWIFGWTQNRSNLPTWLGIGQAIGSNLKGEKSQLLREMYRDWDTFRTMVDLVEMVLFKSEPAMAQHYENILVTNEKAKELGSEIREIHLGTEQAVLDLTGHKKLAENNKIVTRAMQVKNPYVDCLNVLQVESLKRLKNSGDGAVNPALKDALTTTITGISNGMGNTG